MRNSDALLVGDIGFTLALFGASELIRYGVDGWNGAGIFIVICVIMMWIGRDTDSRSLPKPDPGYVVETPHRTPPHAYRVEQEIWQRQREQEFHARFRQLPHLDDNRTLTGCELKEAYRAFYSK